MIFKPTDFHSNCILTMPSGKITIEPSEACKLANAKVEKWDDAVFNVVDRQLVDEIIWSQPETIFEAYLQVALKHLHAVIQCKEMSAAYYATQYGPEHIERTPVEE